MICQGYNDASVTSGYLKGAQGVVNKSLSMALFVLAGALSLNSALTDSCSSLSAIRNFIDSGKLFHAVCKT